MRVRIVRTPVGSIDGVQVSLLNTGTICDLPAALATCLIVEGWAEAVHPSEPPEQRSVQRRWFVQDHGADKKN